MIEVEGLTKRYDDKLAVDDLVLTARTGRVTGLLGPNGAGKSTTMRMILGLHRPTAGRSPSTDSRIVDPRKPLAMVGALLDAHAVQPRSHGPQLPRVRSPRARTYRADGSTRCSTSPG